MTLRRKIIIALAGSALLALGVYFFWPNHEPKYQGKPVSYWFRQYCLLRDGNKSNYTHEQLDEAFDKLGTNALPYLTHQALSTAKDSTFRKNVYEMLGKLPESWHVPQIVSYDDIRSDAVEVIMEIHPPAMAVLPFVKSALEGTNEPQHKQAFKILIYVGEGKEMLVPYFARALHDQDSDIRGDAISWITYLGPPAKAAVPDLIEILKGNSDTNQIDLTVAPALASMGSNALAAIPKLQAVMAEETSWYLKANLATAIYQIDPQQTNALAVLLNRLSHDSPEDLSLWLPPQIANVVTEPRTSAEAAAQLLASLGTNGQLAIPVLIEALNTTNTGLLNEIGTALRATGASADLYLPKLRPKMKSDSEETVATVARIILSADPADKDAQLALIELIHKKSEFVAPAIMQIYIVGTFSGTMDPNRPVNPVIEEALKSDDEKIQRAAAFVQGKINK